jgi:hypothetical protein
LRDASEFDAFVQSTAATSLPPEEDAMRLFTIGALLLFVVTATSASAQQSTLDTEILAANPPQPQITANCNPAGTSTISFTASGIAAGPYPGTYTETGVAISGRNHFLAFRRNL